MATEAETAMQQADNDMLAMLKGKESSPGKPGVGGGDAPAPGPGPKTEPEAEPDEVADDIPAEGADIEDSEPVAEADEAEELADYAAELGFDADMVKRRVAVLGPEAVRKALDAEREAVVARLNGGDQKPGEEKKPEDLTQYLNAIGDESWRQNFLDNNPDGEPLLNALAAMSKKLEALEGDTKTVRGSVEQFTRAQQAQVVAEVEDFYEQVWKSGDKRFGPPNALQLSPSAKKHREEVAGYADYLMRTKGISASKALKASHAKMPKAGGQQQNGLPAALRGVPARSGNVVKQRGQQAQEAANKQTDQVLLQGIKKVFG